ncbi:MAG: site-2 protease family protein [Micromonosporaceae bacterium]|jgi:Zn-dependent protease/predicted transcriptional regulator
MRATVSLGRWFGVPVGANAGVLVILVLVGFALGVWHFPALYPGEPAWRYVLAGATAAVLLVASVLVHELSHAVVAQANGIKVERIVLWLLGGVAELRGEPRSPGADLAVAAVGPATSLVLGGLFGVTSVVSLVVVGEGLTTATLAYLAAINVLLALFNLVPAAPLDGGRVLRAAVWKATGDRARAAVIATRAGRFFGLALIVLGIGGALLWQWFGGLWLALIGFFLVNAAMAEEQAVTVGEKLRGVLVGDVMSPSPVTAPPVALVTDFIDQVVLRERFSTYPLVDAEGRLSGLVTLNRIRAVPVEERSRTTLQQIACPPAEVPVARPEEALVEVLPRLSDGADGRAVVVDDLGRVVGVISPRDIARVTALADLRAGRPLAHAGAPVERPGDGQATG